MSGCIRGCAGLAGTATVLLVVAYAGWRYGGDVFPQVERWLGDGAAEIAEGPVPSQAIADSALERFNTFRTAGLADSTLALNDLELTSIVRYALPGIMPDGIREPTIRLDGDRVVLSARVAVDAFPDIPAVSEISGLLPDTVRIEMRSNLLRLNSSYAALVFDGVEASGIPLPDRVIPGILDSLGRSDRPGLPRSALAIPLPTGIANAYAADGALVFESAD